MAGSAFRDTLFGFEDRVAENEFHYEISADTRWSDTAADAIVSTMVAFATQQLLQASAWRSAAFMFLSCNLLVIGR